MWRGFYIDQFELVGIDEDYNKGGDNKLALEIKERKITTSGFSPTISRLLINFGTTGAGMHEYAANLQVGKKYCFNGDNLQNAKILAGKTGNKLDINNSVNDIPEIREFNEEGEIITHGPVTPKKPLSSTIKEKILGNLDKISFDQAGHLANAELLRDPQNEYGTQQRESKGVYQIKIDNEEINLRDFDRLENEKNWFEIRNAIVSSIKQNIKIIKIIYKNVILNIKFNNSQNTYFVNSTIKN